MLKRIKAREITCPSGYLYQCEGEQRTWEEMKNNAAKYNTVYEIRLHGNNNLELLYPDGHSDYALDSTSIWRYRPRQANGFRVFRRRVKAGGESIDIFVRVPTATNHRTSNRGGKNMRKPGLKEAESKAKTKEALESVEKASKAYDAWKEAWEAADEAIKAADEAQSK